MRELTELAGLGTADVQAITPKIISKTVDSVSRKKAVVSQIFRENRDLEKTKGRTIVLPNVTESITVESVSEGSSVSTSSTISYTGTTVEVSKFGIRLEIDNEALETPVRDVLKDFLFEAGRKLAEELDLRAQTIALDLKSGTITSWTGGTLGSTTLTPIVSISSVSPGATVSAVDYYDGKVLLSSSVPAATVTFLYSNRCKSSGLVVDASEKSKLTTWDLLKLRSTLLATSVNPDIAIVNSNEITTLLYDPDVPTLFVNAKLYNKDLINGEIGMVADLKLVESPLVPEGAAIMVDSSRLGYHVIKRDLEAKQEDRVEIDRTWYHLWTEREFAVTDDNAIGIVVNAKAGSFSASDL